jgi:type II secretory pathway component PulM
MAAVVALLVLVLMLVWIAKWELAASTREADALALAQRRFPAASDLDSAERLVAADMAKRGQGAANFTAPMAAVLAAMQPVPSIRLRDLGYSADGTLRFTAAAPRAEDVNAVLIALQNAGWKVTVPPSLASDPTRGDGGCHYGAGAMIARVQAWYTGLTTRERTLVTIAGALAGLIVLIYGIVLPVGRAFDAADAPCGVGAAHGTADGGAAAARCRPAGPASRTGTGPVEQAVAASAEQAGFVLQSTSRAAAT